jgi:quinohemoprotein ethanol dehydrogenase
MSGFETIGAIMRRPRAAMALAGAVLLCAMAASDHSGNAILGNEADGANWPAFGRTFSEQHYSPLEQVNQVNVARLGLAWFFDLPVSVNAFSTPLEVDGTLFLTEGQSVIHALDARTGGELWSYDPQVGKVAGDKLKAVWGTRGIAWWDGKVYSGTQDGRLIALDGKTGKLVWSVVTTQPGDNRYISGPPRVFNGKVIIGHGGAEFGATRGYVTAYDARTGKQVWRFYTVPGDPAKGFENEAMAMAAKTWTGEWWKYGGGGTAWNAMTYDPKFNRVYIGTGNGQPWNQKIRSPGGGDNLFLCSIVALDADTGKYAWHYQANPGETWDYNCVMDIQLVDLPIAGKVRPVILHAPKNGFFYVIDRTTGKLISAEKITKVTWASHIDLKTGRPVENPNARFQNGDFDLWPKAAHNWFPMAYSPRTGLSYIPVQSLGSIYSDDGIDLKNWKPTYRGEYRTGVTNKPSPPDPANTGSWLLAWNPVTQKEAWRLKRHGLASAGVMATAGNLVFQGNADGQFVAYDALNGKILWSYDARNGVIGAPISYMLDGKQYVTVLAGFGGTGSLFGAATGQTGWGYRTQHRRVLTFVLDGKTTLPPGGPQPEVPVATPGFKSDPVRVAAGGKLFENCVFCHGYGAVGGGAAPDLRASMIPTDAEAFASVVRGGALVEAGMPKFDDLTPDEVESIRHFIRNRAETALAQPSTMGAAHPR